MAHPLQDAPIPNELLYHHDLPLIHRLLVQETFLALGFVINRYSPYGTYREFILVFWFIQIPYWYLEDFLFSILFAIFTDLQAFWAWYSPLPVVY